MPNLHCSSTEEWITTKDLQQVLFKAKYIKNWMNFIDFNSINIKINKISILKIINNLFIINSIDKFYYNNN